MRGLALSVDVRFLSSDLIAAEGGILLHLALWIPRQLGRDQKRPQSVSLLDAIDRPCFVSVCVVVCGRGVFVQCGVSLR